MIIIDIKEVNSIGRFVTLYPNSLDRINELKNKRYLIPKTVEEAKVNQEIVRKIINIRRLNGKI